MFLKQDVFTRETKIDIKNYNINNFVRFVFNLQVFLFYMRVPTITKTS